MTRRGILKSLLVFDWLFAYELQRKSLGTGVIVMDSDRYKRGWEKLKEIDREQGERVIEALKDVAPDLARYVIEFPFGDIYSRPGLDLKSREIATVAALTAMGNAAPQLKVHIHGALNVGPSRGHRSNNSDGGLCGFSRCA
jgi:4-carboxymuconolactone decarboxylase